MNRDIDEAETAAKILIDEAANKARALLDVATDAAKRQFGTPNQKTNDTRPSEISLAAIAAANATTLASTAARSNADIMKELSEIKTNLAVNTSESKTTSETIREIKQDIKEIKSLYITRSEHDIFAKSISDTDKDHEERIRTNEGYIRYGLGALGITQFGVAVYLALRH